MRGRYIVSPGFDWLFFIGSPLLAVAAVLGADQLLPPGDVDGLVLTYMAVGHHVPTFLRAYGDRGEYRANRFRLTVVPLLLLPVMLLLFVFDSKLLGIIFIWDHYHFVRQHYGFMRLYDAKNGSLEVGRFNLDQMVCFSWFAAIITHSNTDGHFYLENLFNLGLLVPSWLRTPLGDAALVVAAIATFLYAGHLLLRMSRGQPVSLLKLAILSTTYGVWWFAYTVLDQALLSYAISSCFHCAQYDALAWYYNGRRAADLPPDTRQNRFFRFLHTGRHVWAYVITLLSYGFFSQLLGSSAPSLIFFLNRTTGVLHYYYDSFIWRVRRQEFRDYL